MSNSPLKFDPAAAALSRDPRVRQAAIDHYVREAEQMRRAAYADLFRGIGHGLRRAAVGVAQLVRPGLKPSAR